MPLDAIDTLVREPLIVVAALAAAYVVLATARRWRRRARLRARFRRALDGERDAATILEAHGFTIEGAQVATSYAIEVDGTPVEIALRADYVVARDGERFIAEVKTGRVAPRVQTPATRRQLLEYHVAFRASGVLLVDAETRAIHRIDFPSPTGARRSRPLFWALALMAIALVVVVARA